jgi:hypothetical protein
MPDPQPITVQSALNFALENWKTTFMGLLICVMQVGNTLNLPGPHSKATIMLAIASALMGVVSKDPGKTS